MPKKNPPVYNIDDFHNSDNNQDFYANTIPLHLKAHHFIFVPHKHDFYITVLFTKGSGWHEIDFSSYKIKPGSIFFLSPGQIHNWELSADIDGFIFFHSRAFYELSFASKKINQFPFFASVYDSPVLYLETKQQQQIKSAFGNLLREHKEQAWMKQSMLSSLCDVLYVTLARLYFSDKKQNVQERNYLAKLHSFENLVDQNFKTLKYPKDYAALMNMSEKHLNRICKICLNKTTTDVISDRIILEAKRLLALLKFSVSQIAEELGYRDYAYFSRFFKKRCSETPIEFMKRYIKTA